MYDINCPYCNAQLDIDHDDGLGYAEEETHQQQCNKCNKYFVFTTSISFSYYPEKADCLNGGEHDYEPTITCPKEYTKMRCTMCDEERTPTEEEMKLIMQPKEITDKK